jgi:hypothetical protein
VLAQSLFLAALVFFVCTVRIGWKNSLAEDQGFRQTQTAISAYYMIGQPPRLAYETPVVGPPWAIPYEFPLYQWLVAGLVTEWHTDLEATGRFVSVAFFLFSLLPANQILAQLEFTRKQRLVILSLLLASPFYIYWSRSFMMESMALCFCLGYVALTLRYLETPSPRLAAGVMALSTLGAVVKATTFAIFLLAVMLCWCRSWVRRYQGQRLGSFLAGRALDVGVLTVVPIGLMLWWTHFADGQKELNPIGHYLTSSALHGFNFGSLEQRLSWATWSPIGGRFGLMLGRLACGLVCIPALFLAGRRKLILACALLALSGPLVFTNLYFHHDYYPYAVGIFFIAAVGIALVSLMDRGGFYRIAAWGLLVGILTISTQRYFNHFLPKQTQHSCKQWVGAMTKVIQQETQPDDLLLIVGMDWSSELPYYSQRRALMIPNWHLKQFYQDVATPLEEVKQRGYRFGALVVAESAWSQLRPEVLQQILDCLDLSPYGRKVHGGFVSIYPVNHQKMARP